MKSKNFRNIRHRYVRNDPMIDMPEFDGRVFKVIGAKYDHTIREGEWADIPRPRRSHNRDRNVKRRTINRKKARKFKRSQQEE
jgi:hypothetical protein